jgi:hypothetical protein
MMSQKWTQLNFFFFFKERPDVDIKFLGSKVDSHPVELYSCGTIIAPPILNTEELLLP